MVRRGKDRPRPQDKVPSPCIRECNRIDFKANVCLACFRNMDEIGSWWSMSDEQKLEVLKRTAQRRGRSPVT